jgi:hypothetical protein
MSFVCFNDLIGLPYQWGKKPNEGATDCLQLMSEARRRLGLYDYSQDFEWIYEKWEEEKFPGAMIARWMKENADQCDARIGAMGYLCGNTGGLALGTVVDDDGFLFISAGEKVVRAKLYNLPRIRLYWGKKDGGE